MEEMKQQVGSPELLPKENKSKLPVILAVLLLLLVGAYAALCIWVSMSNTILPNVQVGETAVGGMTVETAAQTIKADADAKFAPQQAGIEFDKTGALFVSGEYITADSQTAALLAYSVGRDTSPAWYGLNFLKALTTPTALELPVTYDPDGPDIYATLDNAFLGHEYAVVQSTYTVVENEIQVHKGTPGLRYDRDAAAKIIMQNIVDAAKSGEVLSTRIEPVRTEPDRIDWDAIAAQVYVAPSDAAIDSETKQLIPSVTGVSLDVANAKALYAQAGDGDALTIPLTFTQPKVTTDLLFRDVMGEVNTWISGVANRVANVSLAAKMCNGIVLMPGDEFSYWDIVGPCSTDQGFLPAPSYVNGQTVDSIAGGICQVSSSIYYACLKANLEIVERRNHTYAVEYVPDGADATVFSGSPDFRFRNDTDYPILLSAVAKGRNLTVQIVGTKTDDTYVKMQFTRLSTTDYATIYKGDASIPLGTTKVSVTPYTGRKVEAYRCVYSGDGTLLSKTLESVNNYKKRDQIILCNPAELHLYDPSVPAPAPSVSPEPSTSPEPSPSPAPVPSETPAVAPIPSEAPAVTEAPLPESSASPEASAPSASPTPAPSAAPSDPPAAEAVSQ